MVSILEQKEFYNKYWANQDYLNSLKLRRAISILNYFKYVKKKYKQPKTLDLGCGDGRFSSFIGFFGPTTGLELSSEAVNNANRNYPWVEYVQADILSLNKNHESYDCVISQEVIEHVEDKVQFLKIICNCLKPGGYLILTTPNKYVFDKMERGNWSNQPIENIITYKQLKNLVKPFFKIESSKTIIVNFGNKGILKVLNYWYLIKLFDILGLAGLREYIMGKCGFGIHSILFCRKLL